MKKTGYYAYSFNGENDYIGFYDSVEKALASAKDDKRNGIIGDLTSNKETICSTNEVYVGEVMVFEPWFSAEGILEKLQNDAYDEAGDIAEDYLVCKNEDIELLEKMLLAAYHEWEETTNNKPDFYTVTDINVYEL